MKILFSCSKEMNLENLVERNNDFNFKEVDYIIKNVKDIPKEEYTKALKCNEEYYDLNQNINIYSKKAIDLYSGISFRQISNKQSPVLKDVMILSALYGFSYAFDYISPYRYDYTIKGSKLYRKEIYNQINSLLENEDLILNLASKEFSTGIINDNIVEFEFYTIEDDTMKQHSVASKKMRGQVLNHIINYGYQDLINLKYDGYEYNKEMSNKLLFVYTKHIHTLKNNT